MSWWPRVRKVTPRPATSPLELTEVLQVEGKVMVEARVDGWQAGTLWLPTETWEALCDVAGIGSALIPITISHQTQDTIVRESSR